MTNETYRKATEILSEKDICSFAERLCSFYGFEPEKDYRQRAESEVMTGAARRMLYIHRAVNLFRRAIFLGATNLEIYQIAQYLTVLIKAIDHKLDFRQCEKDMHISDLDRKYSENAFMSLAISAADLEKVISRDNNYYEVRIKNEDR